jgi:membrane protein YdbS with pleckstrin-like domain
MSAIPPQLDLHEPDPPADAAPPWQALPARSRPLFLVGAVLPLGVLGLIGGALVALVASTRLDVDRLTLVVASAALAGFGAALFGLWLGTKQYRHTAWRLDAHGLALRRGRLWQRETRVPASRVQHLDIKRGPLQRGRDLATLVVHTAGTRHSSVTVPHLDAGDAERLRDRLGRAVDHDDD